ncbi:hypothetical protein [Pseudoalteromonas viridis]|uniref:Uncharacterized protein n=1 Tax=Pseudoalteromonas viridis TaxID=339617 RepID=A0ABX7V6W1_9GAMM|nr:hypothetical protein [Pseudoalteromonas viridis]QTL35506.1 hypothetical protein J5X90_00035 [Pseudoalteromonas viridis]
MNIKFPALVVVGLVIGGLVWQFGQPEPASVELVEHPAEGAETADTEAAEQSQLKREDKQASVVKVTADEPLEVVAAGAITSATSPFEIELRPLQSLHDLRELQTEYEFIRDHLESTQAVDRINSSDLSKQDLAALKRTYTHLNKVIERIAELDVQRIEQEFAAKYGDNAFAEDMRYVRNTVAEVLEKRKQARREWQQEIETMKDAVNEEQDVQ